MSEDLETPLRVLTRHAGRRGSVSLLKLAFRDREAELADSALEVAVEIGDPIGTALLAALREAPDPVLERRLVDRLDDPRYRGSLPLNELKTHLLERILERGPEAENDADAARRGVWLHALASTHHSLGRRDDAIRAAESAVGQWRALGSRHHPAATARLGESLVLLGLALATAERRPEAELAVREAVEVLEAHPGLERLQAEAWQAWSEALSDLGRPAEALDAARNAVRLWRGLHRQEPLANQAALAGALMDEGLYLSELGRFGESLVPSEEAEALLAVEANERTDRAEPAHARALHGLGNRYDSLGRHAEALRATERAVDVRRRLFRRRPEAFRPDLARSLVAYGSRLRRSGRTQASLEATKEAVVHLRELAGADPEVFTRDLALALGNLGNHLANVGRYDDALAAALEAVDVWSQPESGAADLRAADRAWARSNLGVHLADVGRHLEALEITSAAAAELRELGADSSPALEDRFWMVELNVVRYLLDVGRPRRALDTLSPAVEAIRERRRRRTAGGALLLAKALDWMSTTLRALGRLAEAERASREAMEWIREATREGGIDAADAAPFDVWRERGRVHLGLGQPDEALDAATLARDLAAAMEPTPRNRRRVLQAEMDRSTALLSTGRAAEALGLAEEVGASLRLLDAEAPGTVTSLLGQSSMIRALAAYQLGDAAAAAHWTREAIDRWIAPGPVGEKTGSDDEIGRSQCLLGTFLVAAGRTRAAVEVASAGVRRLEALHEERDHADSAGSLAEAFMNLAIVLDANGAGDAALEASTRATELLESLVAREPRTFELRLAQARRRRASILNRLGRFDEALEALQAALDVLGWHRASRPELAADTAATLRQLGVALARTGHLHDAVLAFKEAVAEGKRSEDRTEAGCAALMTDLRDLGTCLEHLGRLDEAGVVMEEAIEGWRALVAHDSVSPRFGLATSLSNLAAIAARLGSFEEAVARSAEAIELGEMHASGEDDFVVGWIAAERRQHELYQEARAAEAGPPRTA